LGTCWVCAFDEPKAKEILGVPDGVRIVAMTPMGYPAAEPVPFVRQPLRELVRKKPLVGGSAQVDACTMGAVMAEYCWWLHCATMAWQN